MFYALRKVEDYLQVADERDVQDVRGCPPRGGGEVDDGRTVDRVC